MSLPAPVETAVRAALSKKAEDAVILDLRPTTDFTDYFVLLSGTNQRQLVAIADAVRDAVREFFLSAGTERGRRLAARL